MRLLYCNVCNDVVRLHRSDDDRHCACGRSFGRLDERGTIHVGGPFTILGVHEGKLERSIAETPPLGQGPRVYAFVMPSGSPSFAHNRGEKVALPEAL